MSSPSEVHESRVADLECLASLSGYLVAVSLPWRLRPDVARVGSRPDELFIADAKATETSGCSATFSRLRWYAVAIRTGVSRFRRTLLVVAIDAGSGASAWREMITSAFELERPLVADPSIRVLGDTQFLAFWLES